MTKKLIIALDCDGVLFACDQQIHKYAESIVGRKLPMPPRDFAFEAAWGLNEQEMSALHDFICQASRPTRDMPAYDDAVSFVDDLLHCGHDVFFLTSHWRGSGNWVPDREERLNSHWPQLDVVFTHNKARAQYDLLLDDKPSTVLADLQRNVMFTQPWNERVVAEGLRRVNSYEQFLELVNKESNR